MDELSRQHMIWSDRKWEGGGWGQVQDERRLVRYRRSSNGTYQEVWMEPNGHTFYGLYMPEGFIPPPGMGE